MSLKKSQIALLSSLTLGVVSPLLAYHILKPETFWYQFFQELGIGIIIFSLFGFLTQLFLGKEIVDYTKSRILDSINLVDSGICDFKEKSVDIDYTEIITQSEFLVIGLNYNAHSTIFYRDGELLKKRLDNGLKIVICHLDQSDEEELAYQYIKKEGGFISSEEFVYTVEKKLNLEDRHKNLRYTTHKKVLRYSFVYSPQLIWLKLYPTTKEQFSIPALSIKRGTRFFDFLEKDIKDLVGMDDRLKTWLLEKNSL